jgi:transcriptional regulator with XRE-family HTH domain
MISAVPRHRMKAFSGERLKRAREEKGYTQGKLAALIDRELSSVFAWESDQRAPEPSTLVELARVLDVPPADLLDVPRESWSLAVFRYASGKSQREVAEELGLSSQVSFFGNIENGISKLRPDIAAGLAGIYGVTEDELRAAWDRARADLLET